MFNILPARRRGRVEVKSAFDQTVFRVFMIAIDNPICVNFLIVVPQVENSLTVETVVAKNNMGPEFKKSRGTS